jgi:hypothetical protein
MRKRISHSTAIYTGFVFLLMAFISLGLFVASLASHSGLAIAAGVAFVAFLLASSAGFAVGIRKLATAAAGTDYKLSIMSEPLGPSQIDRYRSTYRTGQADSQSWSDHRVAA